MAPTGPLCRRRRHGRGARRDGRGSTSPPRATGRIDGLFACAGGSLHLGSGARRPMWGRCAPPSTPNLMGSVICVKQGAAAMRAPGRPRIAIVLMSSGAAASRIRTCGPTAWRRPASGFLDADGPPRSSGRSASVTRRGALYHHADELMAFITAGGPLLDDHLAQRCRSGAPAPSRTSRRAVRYLIGPESSSSSPGETLGVDGGPTTSRYADYSAALRLRPAVGPFEATEIVPSLPAARRATVSRPDYPGGKLSRTRHRNGARVPGSTPRPSRPAPPPRLAPLCGTIKNDYR